MAYSLLARTISHHFETVCLKKKVGAVLEARDGDRQGIALVEH